MIPYPAIDPVVISIGPFAIRWYALAYIAGIVVGWRLVRRLVRLEPHAATAGQVDDFLTWAVLGVILGGRLGYVLFYRPAYYLAHPLEALMVWKGGMAFHGGLIGVIVATILFCRARHIDFFAFIDRVAVATPIGLGLGRIANFINGELWGRPWDGPWSMVFPADPLRLPRHPSQIYQALLEGLALFALMILLVRNGRLRARRGLLGGAFLVGYGVARCIGELFREPDDFIGFLAGGLTMGQVLSIPMFLVGAWAIATASARAR
ncbi:MAG: prolipoprotein diacylglyceryl transferase [Acetobacteraceae bacterium]|nr:prolipoprotein diacylglyceryl transferase [Acetobacteraceae bacterium]